MITWIARLNSRLPPPSTIEGDKRMSNSTKKKKAAQAGSTAPRLTSPSSVSENKQTNGGMK